MKTQKSVQYAMILLVIRFLMILYGRHAAVKDGFIERVFK